MILRTALCLAACMNAAVAQPYTATIDLPEQVVVATPQVRLGEIASLTTRDPELLRRLMAVPLGQAPRGGDTVTLPREALQRWVRRQTGLAPQQIEWAGAPQTRIARAAGLQARERTADAAKAPSAPPAVARGDWATLALHDGEIALESRVEVLEDGRLGSLVRVKRASAENVLQARVVGPGRLEMAP